MGGGKVSSSNTPSVSNPVVVSSADAAAKARESQLTALKRQGNLSTILSQQQTSAASGGVGYRTLLGGQ